ncbi:MAG: hypothetical protein M1837_002166 [Sclerophora amabilis]|nr:MAG: hypothetical protein M1837_002166 [Sclerophora amabilis]
MPPLSSWRPRFEDGSGNIPGYLANLRRAVLDIPSSIRGITLSHLESRAPAASRSVSSSIVPRHELLRRQNVVPIPAYYSDINNSPPPGTVVGIVLGSVAGFLFILWLLYLCFNMGNRTVVVEEEYVRPHRTSRSSRRAETIEISRSRSPRRSPARTERIIVEERRARTPTVPERDDDIVEVIEENSPVRHSRSSRRQSGFRTVDPDQYGGGNRPLEDINRKSSRRSGRR